MTDAKSNVFTQCLSNVYQIKTAKKGNFSKKILRGYYFLVNEVRKENFILFWEAKVQFLKNTIWLNNAKVITILALKIAKRLMASKKWTGCLRGLNFHEPCRTRLSKMVLVNVLTFLVLKIFHNLSKSVSLTITPDVSKTRKSFQANITFFLMCVFFFRNS